MALDPRDPGFLSAVVRSGLCMGCGLCEGLFGADAVRLAADGAGHLAPRQSAPLTQAQRSLLARLCPGLVVRHEDGSRHHPLWGPCLEASVSHAVDPETRFRGSSGGVLTAVCIHLLEAGLADFVMQIGASSGDPLSNEVKISRSRAEILVNAGSRYAPSAPLALIDRMLNSPGRFVFVGKPCDVAALRRLGREDRRVGERVVAMLSFMCAGVPGRRGSEEILERFGVAGKKVASFRYRGEGWPGFIRAVLEDGTEHRMSYEQGWGTILNRHLPLRCKICVDGTGEFADMVGADAWHGRPDGFPDFGERDGRSLILARTETGRRLLELCVQGGALAPATPISLRDIEGMQPYQVNRRVGLLARLLALRLVGSAVPSYDKMALLRSALRGGPLLQLRSFLGMMRRELARKGAAAGRIGNGGDVG